MSTNEKGEAGVEAFGSLRGRGGCPCEARGSSRCKDVRKRPGGVPRQRVARGNRSALLRRAASNEHAGCQQAGHRSGPLARFQQRKPLPANDRHRAAARARCEPSEGPPPHAGRDSEPAPLARATRRGVGPWLGSAPRRPRVDDLCHRACRPSSGGRDVRPAARAASSGPELGSTASRGRRKTTTARRKGSSRHRGNPHTGGAAAVAIGCSQPRRGELGRAAASLATGARALPGDLEPVEATIWAKHQ